MTDAEWLRDARDRLGLTQAQLAAALHITQSAIGQMERGETRVTARTRGQIEALLAGQDARQS